MLKALDLWLPAYLRRPHPALPDGVTDILLAVCDHFEPLHDTDKAGALERLRRWRREFPPLIENFRAADGFRPRHTFFYPVEQYDPDILAALTDLCHACGGEVELHLHHDHDTPAGFRDKLERGKADLARHGLLAREAAGGICYGFIHGNWALCNSHPEGHGCGVNSELTVLAETGCYADFTMPSAPHGTQTRIINSLYYAQDTGNPKPHDTGKLVSVERRSPTRLGEEPETRRVEDRRSATLNAYQLSTINHQLLLVQGPLGLNWSRRKFGLLPRIENGEITGINPPRADRMKLWTRLGIQVQGQPNWRFIKLHTHGGNPRDMATLLAAPMARFWEHALAEYNDGKKFRLHFVTARELVNVIHAAEAGHTGNPGAYRNHRYQSALPS